MFYSSVLCNDCSITRSHVNAPRAVRSCACQSRCSDSPRRHNKSHACAAQFPYTHRSCIEHRVPCRSTCNDTRHSVPRWAKRGKSVRAPRTPASSPGSERPQRFHTLGTRRGRSYMSLHRDPFWTMHSAMLACASTPRVSRKAAFVHPYDWPTMRIPNERTTRKSSWHSRSHSACPVTHHAFPCHPHLASGGGCGVASNVPQASTCG
jgi:hypothetical protein